MTQDGIWNDYTDSSHIDWSNWSDTTHADWDDHTDSPHSDHTDHGDTHSDVDTHNDIGIYPWAGGLIHNDGGHSDT